MDSVPKCLILLILLASIAEGRILELSTAENELISDGIEKQESVGGCSHQYGFLPCAENAAGYIFLIVVYQVLLVIGGRLISSGSEMLLHITGAGKFGGIIFRILMVLPSMMLMICKHPIALFSLVFPICSALILSCSCSIRDLQQQGGCSIAGCSRCQHLRWNHCLQSYNPVGGVYDIWQD